MRRSTLAILYLLVVSSDVTAVLSLPIQRSGSTVAMSDSLPSSDQKLNRNRIFGSWKSHLESVRNQQKDGSPKNQIPSTRLMGIFGARTELAHKDHLAVQSGNVQQISIGSRTSNTRYEHSLQENGQTYFDPKILLHADITTEKEDSDPHGSFIIFGGSSSSSLSPSSSSPPSSSSLPSRSTTITGTTRSNEYSDPEAQPHHHRQHHYPCYISPANIHSPFQALKTVPSNWDFLSLTQRFGPEIIALAIFMLVPIAVLLVELVEVMLRRTRVERFPNRDCARVRLTGPERQLTAYYVTLECEDAVIAKR